MFEMFSLQTVSLLLSTPSLSVSSQTACGVTALMAAADQGHSGLVRMILSHQDAGVNTTDAEGRDQQRIILPTDDT